MKIAQHQTGDTIVEVLIAIVIASAVLVGAFTISNLSLKHIRMAQERSEAQKIAEQSVESLDAMVGQSSGLLTQTTPFCKGSSNNTVPDTDSLCNTGTDNRYHTSISRITTTTPSYGFAVRVTWVGLTGVNEVVTLTYRAKTVDYP